MEVPECVKFENSVFLILSQFRKGYPLTVCEVYDNLTKEVDLDSLSILVRPLARYINVELRTEGLLERHGMGYILSDRGEEKKAQMKQIVEQGLEGKHCRV